MHDIVVACVGKPSAGKSSFLNAVTDAQAKIGSNFLILLLLLLLYFYLFFISNSYIHFLSFQLVGNYPFTTIEPNYGVTFYPVTFDFFYFIALILSIFFIVLNNICNFLPLFRLTVLVNCFIHYLLLSFFFPFYFQIYKN